MKIRENFGDAWVYTPDTPMTLDEWASYNDTLPPYLSTPYIYSQIHTHEAREGTVVTPMYSYPHIVERVSWIMNLCSTDTGEELLGIYCHRNRGAIEGVTAALADMPMANEDDKMEAMLTLSFVHGDLQENKK